MKYEIIHTSTKKFLKDHFSLTLHCSPMNADLFLDELNKSKIFDCYSFTYYKDYKECEARIRIINKELDGAKISDVRMAIDKIVEKFEEDEKVRIAIIRNIVSACLREIKMKNEGDDEFSIFIQNCKEALEKEENV